MSEFDCVLCQKTHTSPGGWRFQYWTTDQGPVLGWGCTDISYPEMVPEKIKEERKEYLKSQIQTHRQGEFSKEFAELYPEKTKEMVKTGVVTQREVDKAKPVWKGLPNYNNLHKTK